MAKRKTTHKQSKYLTIMLIPDSSGQVRSIKIPHSVFYMVGSFLAVIAFVVILSRTQASHYEQLFNHSAEQLEETIKEIEEIEGSKNELQASFEQEKEKLLIEKEGVEEKINEFESKVNQLQEKINEIDTIKAEIYDKISDYEEKGAPITVSSIDSSDDDTNPVGGPSLPAVGQETFEEILDLLDARLTDDINEMLLLSAAVEDAKPFVMAYPIGWPVVGRITSEFGNRSNPFGGSAVEGHSGLDIKATIGTKVEVTGNGVVTFAGVQDGYGNIVIVDHGYGYSTYYAHNSELLVDKGDTVSRGDIVALSGNTGRSTGPHCHYEVRLNQIPQNPREYLN